MLLLAIIRYSAFEFESPDDYKCDKGENEYDQIHPCDALKCLNLGFGICKLTIRREAALVVHLLE